MLRGDPSQGQFKYVSRIEDKPNLTVRLVAKIDAIQAEYSAFETVHESNGLIDTAKELGVAFVAYGPLGHGWLADDFPYNAPEDFAPDDYRRTCKSPNQACRIILTSLL